MEISPYQRKGTAVFGQGWALARSPTFSNNDIQKFSAHEKELFDIDSDCDSNWLVTQTETPEKPLSISFADKVADSNLKHEKIPQKKLSLEFSQHLGIMKSRFQSLSTRFTDNITNLIHWWNTNITAIMFWGPIICLITGYYSGIQSLKLKKLTQITDCQKYWEHNHWDSAIDPLVVKLCTQNGGCRNDTIDDVLKLCISYTFELLDYTSKEFCTLHIDKVAILLAFITWVILIYQKLIQLSKRDP